MNINIGEFLENQSEIIKLFIYFVLVTAPGALLIVVCDFETFKTLSVIKLLLLSLYLSVPFFMTGAFMFVSYEFKDVVEKKLSTDDKILGCLSYSLLAVILTYIFSKAQIFKSIYIFKAHYEYEILINVYSLITAIFVVFFLLRMFLYLSKKKWFRKK